MLRMLVKESVGFLSVPLPLNLILCCWGILFLWIMLSPLIRDKDLLGFMETLLKYMLSGASTSPSLSPCNGLCLGSFVFSSRSPLLLGARLGMPTAVKSKFLSSILILWRWNPKNSDFQDRASLHMVSLCKWGLFEMFNIQHTFLYFLSF